MSRAAINLAMAALFLVGGTARAGEVEILVESDEAFVDVPFLVAIDVNSEQAHEAPSFPQLENASAELADTQSSRSSSFTVTINGRPVSRNRTTTRYLYRIVPQKEGPLRIPSVEVEVDGRKEVTRPLLLQVTKSVTTDLLFVELKSARKEVFVGEAVDVTLEVWLVPYAQKDYRMSADNMWGMVDQQASSWGPFQEVIERRQARITYRADRRVGEDKQVRNCIVYEITQRVWAERPGPLNAEDVRIVVNYPLKIGRSNSPLSMFDGPRVLQAQTIVGRVTEPPVMVLPIPMEGRPPYYRGAVGAHTIAASAAPTEARVGDPITLTLVIRGPGRMETLQAPLLASLPDFSSRFQVADDPLPGVVAENQKRFTQSVRALSDEVKEIPPIPFAYFDPHKREFVTVHSAAIPLKIQPAERMSATQIVQSGGASERASEGLTRSVHGIESNYADPALLLGQQGLRPTPALAVVAGGCPLAYAACALLAHRRRRLVSDQALRRRRSARRTAQRAIEQAGGAPDALTDALLGYIADRFDLPAGGLTRQEAIAQLRQAAAPADCVRGIDEVLAECESAQFGGGAATAIGELSARVRAGLDALNRAGV